MQEITQEIIDELNKDYGSEYFTFSKKGFTIKYTGALKEWFKEWDLNEQGFNRESILSEMDFTNNFGDFRDHFLIPNGMDLVDYCPDNDLLYPNCFGLTNAPMFGFGGFFAFNSDPDDNLKPRYVFLYFNSYLVLDWLKELLEQGEVTFETFINNEDD